MLRLIDPRPRLGRREFLRVGGLALGGLSWSSFLSSPVRADAQRLLRDKSVIFLFLHGGPSQIETFDPKMNAPSGIRSATGETPTVLPGVSFGGTFTRLASLANKFSVIRSFRTGDGNHDIKPIVGKDTQGANLGSHFARIAGSNHPQTGMPRNLLLFPRAVDPQTQAGIENFGKFHSSGTLGGAYAPFVPGGEGSAQKDMRMNLPRTRLDDRRALLTGLDRIRRDLDETAMAGLDQSQQQAYSTILSGAAAAFDLSREDPRTIQRYDTAPLVRPDQISRKWNNYNNYVDNAKSLGKLLLLARRLCEAGAGFVTVTTNFVWDMHADTNNATLDEGMQYMGLPLDYALSAFIEDLESRGLTDKILLVATGEMGRTPRINANGGRDHWGGSTPLFLYGGGLKMGQVIGQTTRDGGEPATEPYGNTNLLATVMHTLVDLGQLRVTRGVPEDVLRVATAAPPIMPLV